MARVFITGSADGLGRGAATELLDTGHQVVVHARSPQRLESLADLIERGAEGVSGDLADLDQVRDLAAAVNRLGRMDAVIHNAGVMSGPGLLCVNVVAPYLLTALMDRPDRLIYLSSGMHRGGSDANLAGIDWARGGSYSDSKLYDTALAFALARRWPKVTVNAVNPGWVATKMGGAGAPDDLVLGHRTQVWLATGEDPDARRSGRLLYHQGEQQPHPAAREQRFQDALLESLAAFTGVEMPAA